MPKCMLCDKEVDENIKQCDCGCKSFVYGNVKKIENKNYCSVCGENSFTRYMHIDYSDKALNFYECEKCGNRIETIYYRSEKELLLWGGEDE